MRDSSRRAFNLMYVAVMGASIFSASSHAVSDYSLASQQRPAETICRTPMYWNLNDVDPRFGFTHREINTAVLRATQMWNQAIGVDIFVLSEGQSNAIEVNLVYDHRQRLQDYIREADATLARMAAQVEILDAKLAQERTELGDVQDKLAALNLRISRKAAEVDAMIAQHANQRGQVSRQVAQQINELQSAAQQLVTTHNAKLNEFNQRQASFNNDINMRNHLAEQQNRLASQRNQQVRERETEWRLLGLGTESGRHNIQISSSRRGVSVVDEAITVFSASDNLGLVTILAHEFGHAIGINHVQGESSVMAARFESTTPGAYPQQLSRYDLQALNAVCGRKHRKD